MVFWKRGRVVLRDGLEGAGVLGPISPSHPTPHSFRGGDIKWVVLIDTCFLISAHSSL